MKSENTKPIKVPVILQMEALECGAASLAMVLAYYKKWVPLEEVRSACGVSRDGSNALNIARAAQSYGLNYGAFRYTVDRLKEKATYPAVIFWNRNHFVVLCGFKGDYAYLNDPAEGRVKISMEDFRKSYSGICLTFEPGEKFVPDGTPPSTFEFLKRSLKGNEKIILLVMITAALAMIAGILIPVLSRVFTDFILSGSTPSWYEGLLTLFFCVILFQLIAGAIHIVYMKKSAAKLAVTANASFMYHILHMPMEFFSQRMSSDLSQRALSNDTVAATLVGKLAPVFINFILLVFYLAVMLQYSIPLTITVLITTGINLFMSNYISEKRTEISRTQMRDQANLDAATVSGIDMIETIKASGAENGYLERWSGFQASVTKAKVKFDNVNRFLGSLPSLVQQLSGIIVMLLAYRSIMDNHFTAGLLLAFQACMTSFLTPVNDLIDAGQNIQEMKSSIERITDVMDYPEDTNAKEDFLPGELNNARKLTGRIEMKNVTFGYSKFANPVISDFNLTVTPGQRIAFVGSSGCGKSSVAKLLTGLYKPWSGEILYDGKPISDIPKPIFNSSLAMVDQNVILFNDTIANNISMWDKTIEDFDIILASRDAAIHDDIMTKKGGYNNVLEENGKNLSGGQRQRIEIARVLAGDPSIIIMDEATSALDARTEHDIAKFIRDRGITSIIIAHRLSTIRECDEIIVIDKGTVVQRGTHNELINEDGLYKRLVTEQ